MSKFPTIMPRLGVHGPEAETLIDKIMGAVPVGTTKGALTLALIGLLIAAFEDGGIPANVAFTILAIDTTPEPTPKLDEQQELPL